jgi:hypothetical protein
MEGKAKGRWQPVDGFTSLELAVLEAICGALRALVATAQVTERDNTGHGFFTYFKVDRTMAPCLQASRAIIGPNAQVGGMGDDNPMGFVIWFEDGFPDCLEGFQHGGSVDLKLRDLWDLRIERFEPMEQAGDQLTASGG